MQTSELLEKFRPIIEQTAARAQAAREKNDVVALVRIMNELRTRIDGVKELSADLCKLYDRVRFTHLPDAMGDAGLKNALVEGIGRVSLTDDVAVSVSDKEALIAWLEAEGLEDMVVENVNAQTLTAFVRRRIKESTAQKLPPRLPMELLTIRPYTRATITATK